MKLNNLVMRAASWLKDQGIAVSAISLGFDLGMGEIIHSVTYGGDEVPLTALA